MASKTGDNPLSIRQKRRKELWQWQSIFLSSKSGICTLLHFGCFSREGTNSRPLFSLELFLITILFKIGPSREKQHFFPSAILNVCRKFQIAYHTKIYWTEGDIFVLAKMRQRHFFLACQATGSLRNDRQSDRYPPIPVRRPYKLPKWSPTGASSSDCIMKSKLLGSAGVSTLHNPTVNKIPILTSDRQNRTWPNSLR